MRKAGGVLTVLLVGVGFSVAQTGSDEPVGPGVSKPAAVATPSAPDKPRIWIDADPEATEAILRKLREERVNTAAFVQTPLARVMEVFEREHKIAVRIDEIAFDEVGLNVQEPITFRAAKGMPIGAALSLMLAPLDLTYVAKDGLLVITTWEESRCIPSIAVYPVADLLTQFDGVGPDYDSLIELITSSIASDTWAENGGKEADIRPYPQRGALVIAQSCAVHEKVLQLLSALRKIPIDLRAREGTYDPHASFIGGGFGGGGGGFGGGGGGAGSGGGFGFGGGAVTPPSE